VKGIVDETLQLVAFLAFQGDAADARFRSKLTLFRTRATASGLYVLSKL